MTGAFQTTPSFAALAFRGWFPTWLAVVLAALAVAAVVFLYLREAGRLAAWRRALMAGLRALTLVSLLLLLLRPTLLTETRGHRPRPVALLVDDSQSMTARDPRAALPDRWRAAVAFNLVPPDSAIPTQPPPGGMPGLPDDPSRLEVAKAALTNPQLQLIDRLREIGPLHPATFGQSRSAQDPRNTSWIESLKGSEPRTAIADCIFELLNRDGNELPTAIVLATDGLENASRQGLADLARECARLEVPLHVYGVGSSSFGQVHVREVTVPETLFVDDTVSVPVRFRASGFDNDRGEVIVSLNGREVARKQITLVTGDDHRETLTFVPEQKDAQPGKQELTATVRTLAGPLETSDTLGKSVRVIDRKMKVLVIDSTPRWDFKFLQRALLRDRRVEARFILTEGDRKALEAGPPFLPKFPATRQDLLAYDLLVLGDLPSTYLTVEQQQWVRDFVAEGSGLIQLAGRDHAPASFSGTPLADVLPVEFGSISFPANAAPSEPFRPQLTTAGRRHPLLRLDDDADESEQVWDSLPAINWFYPVQRLKPAAEAYLTHPSGRTADGDPMPLLAGHYYGKGYALFCGFDETWRWRFNEADRYFGRFWSQAVYVTGVPRTLGTKLTQLSLDTQDPQFGQMGQLYARLYNPDLKPLTAEEIEATIERVDVGPEDKDHTTRLRLRKLPGQDGDYVAPVPFNQLGRYTLTVDTGSEPATLEYRVTLPPDHELAPGVMAEEELRTLAGASGGRFYREEDLHTLAGAIESKTTPFVRKDEILLWNHWALLWVVGLLAAEWFLRKFNSLS